VYILNEIILFFLYQIS